MIASTLIVGGSAFAATTGDATSTFTTSVSGNGDIVSVGFPTSASLQLSKTAKQATTVQTLGGSGLDASNMGYNIITLDDATGTLAGWTATVQATPLTEVAPSAGFATGTSALVLASGTLNIGQPTSVYADSDQTSSDPAPTISTLTSGLAAIDGSTPVTLASAASGGGAGTWGLQWSTTSPVLEFIVSNDAKVVDTVNYPTTATPYTSTITVTMTENAQTAS